MAVFGAFALIHDFGLLSPFTAYAQDAVDTSPEQAAPHETAAAGEAGHGGDADAHAGEHAGGHSDPVAPILLAIVLILFLAKLGGDLFERISMPAVLGELVVGVILGNMVLLTGWHGFDFFQAPAADAIGNPYSTGAVLKMLAGIGVVLLLFEVGLESTVREMLSVGTSSVLVAILGVVFPMALGWLSGWILIPEHGWQVHAFIGATLCATSVGITARVLKDLGRSQQRESKIILGAAVIDDVLGLVVLAVVTGVIQQGTVDPVGILTVVGKAFGFLLGAVLLGTRLFARPLFKAASYLRGHGLLVSSALVVCFGFSWLANQVGLSPIVGAFAAGLILERTHYRELGQHEDHDLEDALSPLSAMLVPIFFVQMGIQVDLGSFSNPAVWGLAATITLMAVLGKQVCAFGVREKGLNRLAVGLGMIPRGEVGLIFADVGRSLRVVEEHVTDGVTEVVSSPVVDDATFSAIVVMVMVTTMVTPPLLKWAMTRPSKQPEDSQTGQGASADQQE